MLQTAVARNLQYARRSRDFGLDPRSGRTGPALVREVQELMKLVEDLNLPGSPQFSYGGGQKIEGLRRRSPATPVLPVVAARMSVPARGACFDLREYLPESMREVFDDPGVARLSDPGRPPSARVHASRDEWGAFLRKLEQANVLDFCLEEEIPCDAEGRPLRAGYFALRKSDDVDRTICNRRPQNSQLRPALLLREVVPHGSQFCDLSLGPEEVLRISLDDLPDYYHTCKVSDAKARWNAIGPLVDVNTWQGSKALGRLEKKLGASGFAELLQSGERIQPIQSNLVMGDSFAVQEAQIGHMNVLRSGGLLRDEGLLLYRQYVPRAECWSGCMVDDYAVVQKVGPGIRRRDVVDMAQVDAAYRQANLHAKLEKRRRFCPSAVVWGAFLDGTAGWVSADMHLILRTVWLSQRVLELGAVSTGLWRSVVGLWSHIYLWRRSAMCLLSSVYRLCSERLEGEHFVPTARAAQELQMLCLFAPFLGTNLRAHYAAEVFASDASPFAGAIGGPGEHESGGGHRRGILSAEVPARRVCQDGVGHRRVPADETGPGRGGQRGDRRSGEAGP